MLETTAGAMVEGGGGELVAMLSDHFCDYDCAELTMLPLCSLILVRSKAFHGASFASLG